jgi:hypothetical protein
MTQALACGLTLALVAFELQPAASQSASAALTAEQLVASVLEAETPGMSARATLTRTATGSKVSQVRQLLIKGRRARTGSMASYQQLWPAQAGGRALVIRTNAVHQPSGFVYESGKVTPLSSETLASPFFDSDLRVEDVVEGFWHWGAPKIVGEESIGQYRCTIVDFHPGPDVKTAYSLVKAWISPELAIALRVETFGPDGRLVKRLGMYRVLKVGKRWLPAILTVEPADGASRTVLEGVKIQTDLHLTAADFTIASLKRAIRALE